MANLMEPVTMDKDWIIDRLKELAADEKYGNAEIVCKAALAYYNEKVRNDLDIYPGSVTLGAYCYHFEKIAYRKKERDYVVISMYVDSLNEHPGGGMWGGEDGLTLFESEMQNDDRMYNWVCEILDRRIFYSAEDLISNYEKKCGNCYNTWTAPSVQDKVQERNESDISKIKEWMSQL